MPCVQAADAVPEVHARTSARAPGGPMVDREGDCVSLTERNKLLAEGMSGHNDSATEFAVCG